MQKANNNFKIALNKSVKANRRAKASFYNSLNSTMQNYSISAKKMFKILTNLINNKKLSSISTLIENDQPIDDPKEKKVKFLTQFFQKGLQY